MKPRTGTRGAGGGSRDVYSRAAMSIAGGGEMRLRTQTLESVLRRLAIGKARRVREMMTLRPWPAAQRALKWVAEGPVEVAVSVRA